VSRIFAEENGGNEHFFVLAAPESSQSMSKRNDPVGYVAKYVNKPGGGLHFGGTIGGVNFSKIIKSVRPYGRKKIAVSANLEHGFFHMNDPRVRRKR
jgi:hypothetical protein